MTAAAPVGVIVFRENRATLNEWRATFDEWNVVDRLRSASGFLLLLVSAVGAGLRCAFVAAYRTGKSSPIWKSARTWVSWLLTGPTISLAGNGSRAPRRTARPTRRRDALTLEDESGRPSHFDDSTTSAERVRSLSS